MVTAEIIEQISVIRSTFLSVYHLLLYFLIWNFIEYIFPPIFHFNVAIELIEARRSNYAYSIRYIKSQNNGRLEHTKKIDEQT